MIVSMTRLEEKARVKCEQYWPGNSNGINGSNSSNNMKSDNNCVITSCKRSPSISSRINSTSSNKKLNDFKMKLYDKSILPPPVNFRTSVDLKESNGEQQLNEFHCDNNNVISSDLIFTNGLSHLSQSTINFGDISVTLLDTMELAYYTVRSFVLQKVGTIETREVRQLQFTAWPDHGVPNHPAPLLMFLRRVRAECPADSGPIIVHCSAGVGRTGAFILLDILLEQMRHEKAVDVFNTVSRLRAQRNFMVQTEDQYAFIYEALVEAASSGNTEIPVHQLTTHWFRLTELNRLKCQDLVNSDQLGMGLMKTSMNYTNNSSISTGLELEFYQLLIQSNLTKLISSIPSSIGLLSPIDPFSLKTDEKIYGNINFNSSSTSTIGLPRSITGMSTNKSIAAMLPVNLPKNRSLSIIPHDANRVALRAVRGVEGSDYINASYIDGYRSRAAYIATQTPMMNTLEDFWRMIWESGSCLIVKLDGTITLNDLKFMDSPTYWPNLQSARHGFLVVDPIAIYTMPAYIMRELRLTDTRDGSTRTVRQFDASSTADALIHLERQIYYSISNKLDFNELIESSRPIAGSTITTASSTMTSFPPNPSSMLETSFTEDDFLRFNQIPTHVISTFRQCYQPICESMLELISQVHKTKEHFGIDGPITVHCNLGSGITGVFLASSLVLERMRYEGVIDMFQTVKLLRWQRPGLVQTVSEYAFCYATALEYLESFERYTT
uniref:Receptor-type tyrosine-protein phosphatase delta n=1 Tax=Schistosoma haematobium TaxID=6185 RepID=A0A095A2N3_SCHHA